MRTARVNLICSSKADANYALDKMINAFGNDAEQYEVNTMFRDEETGRVRTSVERYFGSRASRSAPAHNNVPRGDIRTSQDSEPSTVPPPHPPAE